MRIGKFCEVINVQRKIPTPDWSEREVLLQKHERKKSATINVALFFGVRTQVTQSGITRSTSFIVKKNKNSSVCCKSNCRRTLTYLARFLSHIKPMLPSIKKFVFCKNAYIDVYENNLGKTIK